MRIQLSEQFSYTKLLRFVVPSIMTMMFVSIYGVVDGLFVSNFVGKTPFAAINLVMPLLMILGALGFMLGTGGSAIVGKTLGEGDSQKAKEYFSLLVYATFIGGVVFMIIGQIFLKPISILFGAEGDMLVNCISYGRIILLSLPFFMLQYIFQALFITAEKPRLGFIMTVIAGVTNIVFDAIFIVGFNLGVEGAAIATALSETVGGIAPVIYFVRKNDSLLRIIKTKLYVKILLRACVNGCSELMTHISSSIVTMIFNIQLLRYMGENGVAAYGVIMYVCFIFVAVFLGYSMGVAPIISYNYGAKNKEEMQNMFRKSITIIGGVGIGLTLFAFCAAKLLAGIFVGYDAELMEITVSGLRIYSFSFLICGFNIFGSSFFTALNNGLISALISFLRAMVFECGCILIIPALFGAEGIWFSIIVAEIGALIVTTAFIISNRKKYHYI